MFGYSHGCKTCSYTKIREADILQLYQYKGEIIKAFGWVRVMPCSSLHPLWDAQFPWVSGTWPMSCLLPAPSPSHCAGDRHTNCIVRTQTCKHYGWETALRPMNSPLTFTLHTAASVWRIRLLVITSFTGTSLQLQNNLVIEGQIILVSLKIVKIPQFKHQYLKLDPQTSDKDYTTFITRFARIFQQKTQKEI